MEQLAYEDAVDVYARALEVLELMDEPDEALRCSLLLALGRAPRPSRARVADARAAFERAAESARALGRRRQPGRGRDRDRDAERRRPRSTSS